MPHEAFVPQALMKRFDCVGQSARVQLPQCFQLFERKGIHELTAGICDRHARLFFPKRPRNGESGNEERARRGGRRTAAGTDASLKTETGTLESRHQDIVDADFHCAARKLTSLGSTFSPGLTWLASPTSTSSPSFTPERTSYFVGVSIPSFTVRSSTSLLELTT